ncbi:MAG: hypothetical protein LBR87_06230, partial [Synergistaceae bacterium]|nr:hypothetical protein [Synergistaceae bacterium]
PAFVPFLSLGSIDGFPLEMCRRYHEIFGMYFYDGLDGYYREGGYKNLHVLLGKEDELINHAVLTKPLLPAGCRVYEFEGGTHRLEFTPEVEAVLRGIIR